MKLTKMQVSALADRIINEIKQPIIDNNNKIKESKAYKQFYEQKDIQKILEISIYYGLQGDEYYLDVLINKLRESYFSSKIKKIPIISKTSIENDIIISTIEHDDLNSLIESIKLKYSK